MPLIALIPIVFSGNNNRGFGFWEVIEKIQDMPFYLAIYLIMLISSGIHFLICQTENPGTTWIYQNLPWEIISSGGNGA